VTDSERGSALEAIAAEIRVCTRCRLHEGRTHAVPGEGDPNTEVVLVGEGPGESEDRQGRPFVGRSGEVLEWLLGSIGWIREQVFITNIVKCRPVVLDESGRAGNRAPEPDEIAACAPYLRRQLEVLDPNVVLALGSPALKRFASGIGISQAHGTVRQMDPSSGAAGASLVAMFHPAFFLRGGTSREMYLADMAVVPPTLETARKRRAQAAGESAQTERSLTAAEPPSEAEAARPLPPPPGPGSESDADQLTLF
jgi:DNA polymerase